MKDNEKAPKAPKKAKKQKAPKAAKPKKAPKEPSEKKKIPKIFFIILPVILLLAVAFVVVYMVFFRAPSVQDEIDKIKKMTDIYKVGSDEIPSLESVVAEGMAVRTSVETPIVDEETGEAELTEFTYRYREVNDTPLDLAEEYYEFLVSEEQGFTLTDQEHHTVEAEPEFDNAIGSVILAKASVDSAAPGEEGGEDGGEEGGEDGGEDGGEAEAPVEKLAQVIVAWSEYALAVQVTQVEGTILPPVKEPDPSEIQREPLALKAQLEYFNNLDPAKLGLPGDFMSEYRVYPVDGLVRVSGEPCRVLNVYLLDLPAESNTFMGTFYLSTDNSKVFKLDESGAIVSVDMS